MEAVKYLVVGEHACLCRVVDKAFVDCRYHRREADVVATVLEDGAQSLYLLLRVAEYVYLVPVGEEFSKRVTDEVEILVIYPLGRTPEPYGSGVLSVGIVGGCREVYKLVAAECRRKLLGVNHLFHCFGVALVGNECGVAETVGGDCLDTLNGVVGVAHPYR